MLNKDNLVKALKKYHLNGVLNDAVIEIKDGTLLTKRFKTETGIIGSIEQKDVEVEDCELGIYYTNTLLKMLGIIEKDTKCKVIYSDAGDRVTSLELTDKKGKVVNFATCDPEIVTTTYPKNPKVSDFEISISLNQELIADILKAQGAIDTSAITFLCKKDKLFLVFGYSKSTNDNSISFEVEATNFEEIDTLSFDSDSVKNILQVNSDNFTKATMEISSKGLLKLYFEGTDFKAEYYLLKLETDNN